MLRTVGPDTGGVIDGDRLEDLKNLEVYQEVNIQSWTLFKTNGVCLPTPQHSPLAASSRRLKTGSSKRRSRPRPGIHLQQSKAAPDSGVPLELPRATLIFEDPVSLCGNLHTVWMWNMESTEVHLSHFQIVSPLMSAGRHLMPKPKVSFKDVSSRCFQEEDAHRRHGRRHSQEGRPPFSDDQDANPPLGRLG